MNKDGAAIAYTVEETDITEGYTPVITGDMTTGYTVTNSYTPETTSVKGVKIWDDGENQDGIRPPSITVNLIANGTKIKSFLKSQQQMTGSLVLQTFLNMQMDQR